MASPRVAAAATVAVRDLAGRGGAYAFHAFVEELRGGQECSRVAGDRADEVCSVDPKEVAGGGGGDRGGARPLVERGDLSEDLAGTESVDDGAVSVDEHASPRDQIDGVCLFALPHNGFAGGDVDV